LELRDLIVTPVILMLLYVVAYFVRPFMTDQITRRYFIPALTMKILGALAVGFVYQFYYNGGDTFNYHTHGSRHLWEAFVESPETAFKLWFADGYNHKDIYKYSSRIVFFSDFSSYNVVRIASLCDLFTFSAYSGTAVIFAVFSFVGMWLFFLTFYKRYPHLHKSLAFGCLFIPSVFFWGAGLLKDTISLGCLGIATFLISEIFIRKNYSLLKIAVLLLALYGLYGIKVYILLVFLPAAILWVFLSAFKRIQSPVLKLMFFPLVIGGAMGLGFWAVMKASEDNPKYSIKAIGETARITAYDIRYYTGKDAGSGYSLGELDGSITSMVSLAPQAVNVSLFRPYLWEVKNPLMLLSALESFALLVIVVNLLIRHRGIAFKAIGQPDVLFTLVFSLSFAFAVGVSTFNFGTLVRYKIPALPFFAVALILIYNFAKSERKLRRLEITE
jgi:hypothetical protein